MAKSGKGEVRESGKGDPTDKVGKGDPTDKVGKGEPTDKVGKGEAAGRTYEGQQRSPADELTDVSFGTGLSAGLTDDPAILDADDLRTGTLEYSGTEAGDAPSKPDNSGTVTKDKGETDSDPVDDAIPVEDDSDDEELGGADSDDDHGFGNGDIEEDDNIEDDDRGFGNGDIYDDNVIVPNDDDNVAVDNDDATTDDDIAVEDDEVEDSDFVTIRVDPGDLKMGPPEYSGPEADPGEEASPYTAAPIVQDEDVDIFVPPDERIDPDVLEG